MPNPRYRPRDYTVDRTQFGKRADIVWRDPRAFSRTDTDDQLAAARLQHLVALAIRKELGARFVTVAEHADLHFVSATRLRALLNGESVMRLEDVAFAERTLGVKLQLDLD